METRTPEEIFGHHAAALMKGDIDEIVVDYADDAVFVAPDRVLRGKAGWYVRAGAVATGDGAPFATLAAARRQPERHAALRRAGI
jgi:ketosteroid isomerase-like protein